MIRLSSSIQARGVMWIVGLVTLFVVALLVLREDARAERLAMHSFNLELLSRDLLGANVVIAPRIGASAWLRPKRIRVFAQSGLEEARRAAPELRRAEPAGPRGGVAPWRGTAGARSRPNLPAVGQRPAQAHRVR